MRTVTPANTFAIPDTYTIAQLLYLIRHAKANSDAKYVRPNGNAMSAAGVLAWFRANLHAKINRNEPAHRGRKDYPGWQRAAAIVARNMRERIITRVGDCPLELRARLAHRLYTHDEF